MNMIVKARVTCLEWRSEFSTVIRVIVFSTVTPAMRPTCSVGLFQGSTISDMAFDRIKSVYNIMLQSAPEGDEAHITT